MLIVAERLGHTALTTGHALIAILERISIATVQGRQGWSGRRGEPPRGC